MESPPIESHSTPGQYLPRIILYLLVMMVAATAVLLYRFDLLTPGNNNDMLPAEIIGVAATETYSGEEALEIINHLHGLDFALASGAVGVYQQAGANLTLWVAEAASEADAVQMVVDMEEKIAVGRSPFIPTDKQLDGDRTIYYLDGMGQQHVYFKSGTLVVWLAVDFDLAEGAVAEMLRFYP